MVVGLDMLFPMRPPPEGLCGSVAGRSPGSRVLTRHRLPGLCPVALWLGLAAHSCGGSRGFGYYLTAFPFFVPPNAGTNDRGTIARKMRTASAGLLVHQNQAASAVSICVALTMANRTRLSRVIDGLSSESQKGMR